MKVLEDRDKQSAQLIMQYKQGDVQAFNALWRIWEHQLFNLIYNIVADYDQAKDILQRTIIKTYQNLHQLNDVQKFKPWLYRIAVNYCHSELRKKTRIDPIDQVLPQVLPIDYSASKSLEKLDLKKQIIILLQKLPEEQKTIIVMKEYEGMKFVEIAEALQLPINTVKSRLYYGLKSLRKMLIDDPSLKALYYE